MVTPVGSHPSADMLQGFGLGNLADAQAATVIAHLETCRPCREAVAAQVGDDLAVRRRDAHDRNRSSTRAESRPGASGDTMPPEPGAPAGANVPPELAANQQYEVLRELGRGGMGVVYLARNRMLARQEVLKVVNPDMLARAGGKERFLREIQSAAMLSHPNVVTAYAAFQVGDMLIFAMEHVEGEDLAKVVKAHGPLPVANACCYVRQVAEGLQHAADKKMVHRDIKPQNLILARDGNKQVVKILDFGLAKVLREHKEESNLTGAGMMLGTPDYAAPEQTLDAARADVRADIYSLGCTLYYLLTGGAPFKGNSLFAVLQAHHTEEARAVHLVRPEVTAALAAVVQKMMAKDPVQRYQQPSEVAQVLAPFLQDLGSAAVVGSMAGLKKAVGQETAGPASCEPVTMTEASGPIIRGERKTSLKRALSPKRKMMNRGIGIGLCAGRLLLAALVGLWASGVFQVQAKDGVLVIQVNEPDADVFVDGTQETVTWGAGGKMAEIIVKPGVRQVSVKKEGFTAYGETVTLEGGGRQVVVARLERSRREVAADTAPVPLPEKPTPAPAAPFRWPADKLAAGQIAAPDLSGCKLIRELDFASSEPKTKARILPLKAGYWVASAADFAKDNLSDFACEVVARKIGEGQTAWGLHLTRRDGDDDPRGVTVKLMPSKGLEVFRTVTGTGAQGQGGQRYSTIESHPAIRDLSEWNRLLCVFRGRCLEVYINDRAVTNPIEVDDAVRPTEVRYLRWSQGKTVDGRLEIQRFRAWDIQALPPVEERSRKLEAVPTIGFVQPTASAPRFTN